MAKTKSAKRNSPPAASSFSLETIVNQLVGLVLETGKGLLRRLDDIVGVLLAAFAVVSLLALLNLSVGDWSVVLADAITLWLGWGAWLAPISAGGIAFILLGRAVGRRLKINWQRVLTAELAVVCALALAHMVVASDVGRSLGLTTTEALAANETLVRATSGDGGGLVGWAVALLAARLLEGLAGGALAIMFLLLASHALRLGPAQVVDALIALQRWLIGRGPPEFVVESGATPVVSTSPVAKSGGRRAAPKQRPNRVKYEKRFTVAPQQDSRPARPRKRPPLLPDLALLGAGETILPSEKEINLNAALIESTLADFGIPAKVIDFKTGPSVTQFAVEPGYLSREARGGEARKSKVRVSQISNLANDLALSLSASPLRIEAPVPGKSYVGIEVPNRKKFLVGLRGVMESDVFQRINAPLAIALGRNVAGAPVAANLGQMPHLLIAGTTGSGKSVCIGAIITCLVANNTPDDLRLVMIDPKKVELLPFNGLPHLYGRVEVELERIIGTLRWVTREMDRRYRLFEDLQARDLDAYNRKIGRRKTVERLPRIVVLVDEMADLMMMAQDETEKTLTRLAQMARATGIHLVVATQRPSTDVVTGLIKANFPARISFAVASSIDSRVVLDTPGAEALLGQGDMLYLSPEAAAPLRLQGVFVGNKEVDGIVEYWREQWAEYESTDDATEAAVPAAPVAPWDDMLARQAVVEDKDDQLAQAIEVVKKHKNASASLLQRKLRIGYPRAARLMDELHEMGIVGRARQGGKTREVLIHEDDDPIGRAAKIIGGEPGDQSPG